MIKEYWKQTPIKAERFDGSNEMIEKYDLKYNREASLYEDREIGWVISTLEGDIEVHINDWIATGINGEHYAIANDVFLDTYSEKKKGVDNDLPHFNSSLGTPSMDKDDGALDVSGTNGDILLAIALGLTEIASYSDEMDIKEQQMFLHTMAHRLYELLTEPHELLEAFTEYYGEDSEH